MKQSALNPDAPRRLKARRGSLVVTAFVFVIAMTMMAFGIHTMLKNQLEQASTLKGVSMAKLQTLYLAEMGVNYWMYTANQNLNASFPTPAIIGTQDFKTHVAMVRNVASGVATCLAGTTPAAKVATGYPPYMITATLTTSDGTFNRVVYFDVAKLSGGQYVLNGYRAQ
jgi:Flp pilus assembly protein TadG